MKPFIFSFLLILSAGVSYAQIPVGFVHDLNGMPFDGYFDLLAYSPEKQLSKIRGSIDAYETGYYYNKAGDKIKGLIKFQGRNFYFKTKGKLLAADISPKQTRSFVLALDSFVVIKNFYFKNKLRKREDFAQYISSFDGKTFLKHYRVNYYAREEPIKETFLLKKTGGAVWENFPKGKKFKDYIAKNFSHIPLLNERVRSGRYEDKDAFSIIKMDEYYSKYKNAAPIFYNKHWEEVRHKKDAKYLAKIVHLKDSIWTFDYYEKDKKIYQINYSSFYPNVKNGEFTCYYPNGAARKIMQYKNDVLKEVKLFDEESNLKTHYKVSEIKKKSAKDKYFIKYVAVNDSLGNNILKKGGRVSLTSYDKFSGHHYTAVYENDKKVAFYRLSGSDTIFQATNFQITNKGYQFKIQPLQNKFNRFLSEKKYLDALKKSTQGMLLVFFLVDNQGVTIKSKILNKIDPEIDKLVNIFIHKEIKTQTNTFGYKFKLHKKENTESAYEFVLPIVFGTNRFYRKQYNWWWWHQWWWNEWWHHQHINPVIPLQPPKVF